MQNKKMLDYIVVGVVLLSIACALFLHYGISNIEMLNLPVGDVGAEAEYVNDGYTTEWKMLQGLFKFIRDFLLY